MPKKVELFTGNMRVLDAIGAVDDYRGLIRERIQEIVDDYKNARGDTKSKTLGTIDAAKNLEIGIYNSAIMKATQLNIPRLWSASAFVDIYNQRAKSVLTNLDPNSYVENKELIRKFVQQDIMPHEVAFMTTTELFPEKWEDVQESIKKSLVDYEPTNFFTLYTCGKCGAKKRRYTNYKRVRQTSR